MSANLSHHLVRWHTSRQCFNPSLTHIPAELRPWLVANGSLTRQLTQLAGGQFRVEPFRQGFERIYLHESQLMHTAVDQQAWVREVYLYGSEAQPWVKARSIIPVQSLKGQGLRLRYLKNRSLGSLLFSRTTPHCIRQIALLPEGWTRRSLYIWHQRPLIVQETFLPDFQHYLLNHSQL